MKIGLNIFLLLATLYSYNSNAFTEYEDDELNDLYKRWTNVQRVSDHEFRATFLSPHIIKRWHKLEKEPDSKKRIGRLLETVTSEGYAVYLIKVEVVGTMTSVIIGNVKNAFSLSIAEKNPLRRKPVAYSPNIETELFGDWEGGRKSYYGVLAFKIGTDKFSFQTVTMNGIEAEYKWSSQRGKWKEKESESKLHVQFSFFPNGSPRETRLFGWGEVRTADIINILSLAVDVVSLLSPVKALR